MRCDEQTVKIMTRVTERELHCNDEDSEKWQVFGQVLKIGSSV